MFYFKLFNCDATFDEKTNTLAYAGDHQSFSMKINDSKIRTVYFKFNNECNLKCSYCFQKNSELLERNDVFLFDYKFLIETMMKSNEFDRFILFGGEPFISINYDNIRLLLENCSNKKLCAFSNGTFDKKFLELLYSHTTKIEMITVTLDGDQLIHDQRRVYSNGEGTFYVVLENLVQLQKYKIPFTVQVNVDKSNVNNLECLFQIIQERLPNVTMVILNRVLHELNEISEIELLECFIRLKKEFGKICIVPNAQCYKKIYSIITNNGVIFNRCEIGNTYVFDFQTHRLYACPQSDLTECGVFTTSQYTIDKNTQKEYVDYSEKNTDRCLSCSMRSLCMYGCIVERDIQQSDCVQRNQESIQFILDNFVDIFDFE